MGIIQIGKTEKFKRDIWIANSITQSDAFINKTNFKLIFSLDEKFSFANIFISFNKVLVQFVIILI
jgi:hypothetical protein